ncbi:MAG: sigma-70 family RNA polymerase sigma factor [Propionibacteriaceae bacterium]
MSENELAERFDATRGRLHAVATRMLGSGAEADDAVQEAWLRLSRSRADDGRSEIGNLDGWLTTVVARICLDALRRRRTRRETPIEHVPETPSIEPGPDEQVIQADAIGAALVVVLDTLAPAERTAFVLHDLFGVPFEEIAPVVGRSVPATRQLASRARRRVRGGPATADPDRERQRRVVSAFMAASRGGDFAGLLAVLDPDAVVRADAVAAGMGAEPEIAGATEVARAYTGRAQALRLALLDDLPGGVWMVGPDVKVAFCFTTVKERITRVELVADPDVLAALEVELL